MLLLLLGPGLAQAQFTYATNAGTVTVTGYTGTGGAANIPASVGALPVVRIGDSAFTGSTISSLSLPASVTSIGAGVFDECYSLTAITVNAANPVFSSANGVLFDKTQANLWRFPAGKTGAYTLPNTVTNLAAYGFYECAGLTSITFSTNLAGIGAWAFAGSGLSNVAWPNRVTSIGDAVFYACSSLANLSLPASLRSIGDSAFAATSLTSLVLPASLTNIADAAFDTCSSLTSLYFLGNPPAVGAYVFNGDNTAVVYYLPGAQGWGATFAADPALRVVLWNPVPQLAAPNFGVRTNRFGFPIAGPANALVVVEACTNVAHPIWVPLSTNRLTGGASYFADAPWTGVGNRFYRLRAP